MKFLCALLSIIGRFCIAAIFLASAAMNKIPNFNEVVGMMGEKEVPNPSIALIGAIAFLIVGGISVAVGWYTRFGALLLTIFVAAASYYFHDFWHLEGAEKMEQMTHFMKNTALFGGLLFLVANGGGCGSIDAMLAKKKTAAV